MKEIPVLVIVSPCYNEEDVLSASIAQLAMCLNALTEKKKISANSFCFFVDDGSHDKTWNIIENEHKKNSRVKGLKLAKNVGHQNALLAGLLTVRGKVDCAISIDVDLQDDIRVIETMVNNYMGGDEIVYGVRSDRTTDSRFKSYTARFFYHGMKWLGVELIYNHADFRLMGKKSLTALSQYGEYNVFLRGLCTTLGFRHSIVEYKRLGRKAGYSKYPLLKMIALAWNGITSFSIVPLRLFSFIGGAIFIVSLSLSFWAVFIKLFTDRALSGWTSTVLPIYFIGGIQMLGIGILGEYLGKIFLEVKRRPRFIKDIELE